MKLITIAIAACQLRARMRALTHVQLYYTLIIDNNNSFSAPIGGTSICRLPPINSFSGHCDRGKIVGRNGANVINSSETTCYSYYVEELNQSIIIFIVA